MVETTITRTPWRCTAATNERSRRQPKRLKNLWARAWRDVQYLSKNSREFCPVIVMGLPVLAFR